MMASVMAHEDFPKCQYNCCNFFIYHNNNPLGEIIKGNNVLNAIIVT